MNKAQRSPFSSLDQARKIRTKADMIKARPPQSAACLLRPRCLNKKTRNPIGFLVFLDSLKKTPSYFEARYQADEACTPRRDAIRDFVAITYNAQTVRKCR